jgi:hypothetical protein
MVRPVELQDNLSKTKLLEQVQQLQKAAPDEAQKQFAQELAKKVANETKSVNDLPQADKIIIHREKPKQEDAREKKNKKDKQAKNEKDKNSPSKIDYVA